METEYSEIDELKELVNSFKISVHLLSNPVFLAGKKYFPKIKLLIREQTFSFYVDDEYSDLKFKHPLLSVEIALRTLENYAFSQDYLEWCTENSFDASIEEVRQHYMDLRITYTAILEIGVPIKSFLSDFDFELNAGAARYLRNQAK